MRKNLSLSSQDRKQKLHIVMWKPEGEVKAVLQISHGMQEYIERYDEFANYLNSKGILVVGNDHMGHGHTADSEEELGYFYKKHSSEKVVRDLHRVTRATMKRYPDIPYFLFGHSMGSFLARRYIMTYGNELTGAIICGTGYQPEIALLTGKIAAAVSAAVKGEKHRSKFIDKASFGTYNKKIENVEDPMDWLSTKRETVEKRKGDIYCEFKFTNNGYKMLFDTIEYIQKKKNIEQIPKRLPLFLIAGKEDPVGNYGEGVEQVYHSFEKAQIRDVEMKLYEGMRHEILLEKDSQKVYDDVYAWLVKQMNVDKEAKIIF